MGKDNGQSEERTRDRQREGIWKVRGKDKGQSEGRTKDSWKESEQKKKQRVAGGELGLERTQTSVSEFGLKGRPRPRKETKTWQTRRRCV